MGDMLKVKLAIYDNRPHQVIGQETGVYYGKYRGGQEFEIDVRDYRAKSNIFEPLEKVQLLGQSSEPGEPKVKTTGAGTKAPQEVEDSLTAVPGIGERTASVLYWQHGVESADQILAIVGDDLTTVEGITPANAQKAFEYLVKLRDEQPNDDNAK